MEVVVWSKSNCTFCEQAKQLLKTKGIDYTEKKIGESYTREQLLEEIPHARTVPQILIDNKPIGGFNELKTILK